MNVQSYELTKYCYTSFHVSSESQFDLLAEILKLSNKYMIEGITLGTHEEESSFIYTAIVTVCN